MSNNAIFLCGALRLCNGQALEPDCQDLAASLTLCKLLNWSVPQFAHPRNWYDNSMCLTRLLCGLNGITSIEYHLIYDNMVCVVAVVVPFI